MSWASVPGARTRKPVFEVAPYPVECYNDNVDRMFTINQRRRNDYMKIRNEAVAV